MGIVLIILSPIVAEDSDYFIYLAFMCLVLGMIVLTAGLSILSPIFIGKRVTHVLGYTWIWIRKVNSNILTSKGADYLKKSTPIKMLCEINMVITEKAEQTNVFADAEWYIRYPLGIGVISVALYALIYDYENARIEALGYLFSAVLGLWGAYFTRELVLGATILAIVVFLVKWVISLPTNAVIIIGALMIAFAIRAKK